VIADCTIRERTLDEMLAAENARLREQGRPEISRVALEARVVGDRRERSRLLRLRRRRRASAALGARSSRTR
jgi:transcription elongation GreA/GreB family factor